MIAVRPQPRAFRVIFAFETNEIIQTDQVFLGMNAPDARRCGCGLEVLVPGPKKKIVIQMIALDRAQVIVVATLVFQGPGQPIGNPGGNFQALQQFRLVRLLPGGHFLQSHLFPDAFPQTGILRRDISETLQRNISFFSLLVMTGKAIGFEERPDLFIEAQFASVYRLSLPRTGKRKEQEMHQRHDIKKPVGKHLRPAALRWGPVYCDGWRPGFYPY